MLKKKNCSKKLKKNCLKMLKKFFLNFDNFEKKKKNCALKFL